MSIQTVNAAPGDFGDFEFAAIVADFGPTPTYDPADMAPEGPVLDHRPARTNDKRRAIERSWRGEA